MKYVSLFDVLQGVKKERPVEGPRRTGRDLKSAGTRFVDFKKIGMEGFPEKQVGQACVSLKTGPVTVVL